MEEIQIGDYIRTKGGNICKVLQIRKQHRFTTNTGHPSITPERYFVDNIKQYSISKPYVKKHSKNIIDLIEINDYVNGQKITKITKDPFVEGQIDLWTDRTISFGQDFQQERFIEHEIKTVVTKEQMETIKYIVKE